MTERDRRWSIAALVLMAHVLVLLGFDERLEEEPGEHTEELRAVLFFIPQENRGSESPEPTIRPSIPIDGESRLNAPPVAAPVVESTGPTIPTLPPDWREQAGESARSSLEAQQRTGALTFAQPQKPPEKCVKPKAPEWRKETPEYGFAGGFIPYMRFHDDRCIVVTFIGCSFGDKPRADGTLFDNMNNYPNDSSVPDLDECEE